MIRTLARAANNDIFLFAGQLAMVDGMFAQSQIIKAAILTVKGELQFDTEQGIPYFDTVFKNQNNIYLWRAFVIRRVREFDWVKDVTSFEHTVDNENHVINYTMTLVTNDGAVTIRGIDYNISTISPGGGGGGGEASESLVQNGVFYLPVFMDGNVQVYRQLRQYVDPLGSITTDLSEQTYIKNENGIFVPRA